jgi:PAS domain S-box-containing protein
LGDVDDDILNDFSILAEAVEWLPVPVAIVNREGRLVAVNRNQEELFGEKRERLLGKPVRTIPFLAAVDWESYLARANDLPRKVPCEASQRDGEGDAGVKVWPICDAGDLTGFLVITERPRQKAFDEDVALVRQLITSFPEPLAIVDENFRVLVASRALLALNGHDNSHAVPQSCCELLCRGEWDCAACAVKAALAGSTANAARSRHESSRYGAAALVAWPLPDTSGQVRAALVHLAVGTVGTATNQVGAEVSRPLLPAEPSPLCDLYEVALQACGLLLLVVDRSMRPLHQFGCGTWERQAAGKEKWPILLDLLGPEGAAVVKAAVKQGNAFLGRPRPDSPWTVVLPVLFSEENQGAVIGIDVRKESEKRGSTADTLLEKLSCFAELGGALAH